MNKNDKCLEMRIYECLGIKHFKKLVLELGYRVLHFFDKSVTRDKYFKSSSNYRMKKGNGMQDLRDLKKMLLLNGSLHSLFLLHNFVLILKAINLGSFLGLALLPLVINGYCVMLQRYNWLRIERVLKKCEPIEKAKRVEVCEELTEMNHISSKCEHKVITANSVDDISVEDLKKSATLKELKKYRDFLVDVKKKEDSINCGGFSMGKGKYLRLEYLPDRNR